MPVGVSQKKGGVRHAKGRIDHELVDWLLHASLNSHGKQAAVENLLRFAGTAQAPLAAPSGTTVRTKPSPEGLYSQARHLGRRFIHPFDERKKPAHASPCPEAARRRCAFVLRHEQCARGSATAQRSSSRQRAHQRSCYSARASVVATAAMQLQAQTARELTTLEPDHDYRRVHANGLFSAQPPQVHGRLGYGFGLGYEPALIRPQRICTQHHRQVADYGNGACLTVPSVVDIEATGISRPETEQSKALKQRLQKLASQAESFESMLGAVAGDWADMAPEVEEETANPPVRLPSIGDRNGHCDVP